MTGALEAAGARVKEEEKWLRGHNGARAAPRLAGGRCVDPDLFRATHLACFSKAGGDLDLRPTRVNPGDPEPRTDWIMESVRELAMWAISPRVLGLAWAYVKLQSGTVD